MRKNITSLLCAAVIGGSAFAQPGDQNDKAQDVQLNTITTAVPFLGINPSSREGAMGDAGAGVSADGNSLYWNTAKLIFAKSDAEVVLNYSPWLNNLASDIHLSYLAGYKQIGKRHAIGASLRYFSLGKITFTDQNGQEIRKDYVPNEFEILAGYAFRLNDRWALGLNGKFIYSNLTGGTSITGAETKAGLAGAADLSFSYFNDELKLGKKDGEIGVGISISNIGNKIAYTSGETRDFLPATLRIGTALKTNFDKYNSLTFAFDISKLLVPTPPVDGVVDNEYIIYSGKNTDVGVMQGIIQSFYDAPGQLIKDENDDYIQNPDGTYQVKKGSKFAEEMREINLAVGMEYWYGDKFAVRVGYFHEHQSKGDRKFLTLGAGLKYKVFGLDISYLTAFRRNHPLANTLRFTLRFTLDKKKASSSEDITE